MSPATPTPPDLLASEVRRDGARPFVTYYDDATGERTELSVATLANWVAKTANFLVDELGVEPDDPVVVRLPLHWQAAVVMLGCWSVGARLDGDGDAVATFTTVDDPLPDGASGETVRLSLSPMGVDFHQLVAAAPDHFVPVEPSGAEVAAAAPSDLPPGARVLTTADLTSGSALGYGLVAPLAVGGSAVYVAHADAGRLPERATVERVTHTFGVDVAGLPRLGGA